MTVFSNLIRADKYCRAKPRAQVKAVLIGNNNERHIVKRWLPILNGDVVVFEGESAWCETKAEAVALAQKFRMACREKFGTAQGNENDNHV